jgi:O-antigen ligase
LKRQAFHTNAHFYFSLLIAFFLPLAHYVPIVIILLLLNWFIEGDFKAKSQAIFSSKPALLFCFFYILHLTGLLYTENMGSGNFDVKVKLSLLLFPLIYASKPLQKEQLKPLFLSLLGGSLLCSLILLIRATCSFMETHNSTYFFYEDFTVHFIHPSYLAMYLNVGITWLLIQLYKNTAVFGKFSKSITVLLILFFSFILVLLSSKLGLITLTLIYFVALILYSFKNHVVGIIGLILAILIGIGVVKFVPAITDRVETAIAAITSPTVNNADAESTAVRMLIWKAANQVIAEHPILGTGTGDSKDELIKEYERRGMTGAAHNQLNAHNEFYQVFVSLGLIGFIVFSTQLMMPLIVSIKEKNSMYTFFLIIIILNFLTESMLEREAGVLFYAFFNAVLCFTFFQKKPNSQLI